MASSRPGLEILQRGTSQNEDANDQAVLSHLRSAGSDLTKRTDIVFYLYIPEIQDAREAASELEQNGYRVQIGKPLGALPDGSYESRYSVIAHLEDVPTLDRIRGARRLYSNLASRYNGDYDGWEAAVAP